MAAFRDRGGERVEGERLERDWAPATVAPAGGDGDAVLALQRTAGNAAVSRMIATGTRPVVSRRPLVGEPTVGNAALAARATERSPMAPAGRTRARPRGETRVLQRNGKSAALLKELAEPKVLEFEAAQIAVQTDIINRLEGAIAANKRSNYETREAELDRKQAVIGELLGPFERFSDVSEMSADEKLEFERIQEMIAALNDARDALERDEKERKDRFGRWNEAVNVLGAIELTSLPDDDTELLKTAKFTKLDPNSLGRGSVFDLVEAAGVKEQVVKNTLNTMIKAGQIDYLRKSGLISGDWMVLIEVHYYRRRDQDVSQFHRDTLGQTLFVNLNYHTGHEIAGPEYVLHPPTVAEHEQQIKATLPPEFLADLAEIRKDAPEPTEIMAPIIPAYGAVAFVDEAIHHMTPLRGHRKVKGSDFAKYLKDTYLVQGLRKQPPLETWNQWLNMSLRSDAMYTRRDFARAGMRRSEIDALLTLHGGSGFQTVSIPGMANKPPIERRSKAPLKRQMSERALKKKGTPGSLPPPVTGERRFFRTWVRAVRRHG
jgi:hypothetical protein